MSSWQRSLTSGIVGALTLTGIHELARRRVPYAPRMDVLGMRALRRYVPALQHERPRSGRLRRFAFIGDLVANSVYYSAVAAPTRTRTWTRAATMGLTAGICALVLPSKVGLDDPRRTANGVQIRR